MLPDRTEVVEAMNKGAWVGGDSRAGVRAVGGGGGRVGGCGRTTVKGCCHLLSMLTDSA